MFVQLLKTTPYLSGQHRLDVCLKKTKYAGSYIVQKTSSNYDPWFITTGDCHLAPLSDSLVFTDSIEQPFFNQTYGDNLKQLYRKLKDDFFRDVPAIKSHNILYEDNIWVDTTDHTYECGLKRLRYDKYNKQFSWLCPIWIENANNLNDLYFIMTIYGDNSKNHSMKFRIDLAKDLKDSLSEWLYGISSNLLYIDIEKEKATITGANVESGTPVTADVSYIIPQLIDRERPVMETNSALNQLFSSNRMIARQLINFNFCFSPEDVIPSHVIKEMIGKRWKITIDAYYGLNQLEKVDFLSNYEFIPAYTISENDTGKYSNTINVLDYLEDYRYIDYMYINKTTQVDPYWSLVENPDCIYNFYNGFSSWYQDGLDINRNPIYKQIIGLTQNQPDTSHIEYSYKYNNIGWCTVYDYSTVLGCTYGSNNYSLLRDLVESLYKKSKKATNIKLKSKEVCWVNGLKFDLTNIDHQISTSFKFMMCLTGDDVSKELYMHKFTYTNDDNIETIYCLFVPTNQSQDNTYTDKLTVKSLTMNSMASNDFHGDQIGINYLFSFFNVFKYLVFPEKILFNKSIQAIPAESPFDGSKEITYIKQEYNLNNYIFRYSGALRPYFISPKDNDFYNIDYYFKKWEQKIIELSNNPQIAKKYKDFKEYNKMLNTGYEAIFPSVGYYALNKGNENHNDIQYANGRLDYFSYPKRYLNNSCEFQWYMDGRFYMLPNEINLSFTTSDDVDEKTIKNKLKQKINSICPSASIQAINQLVELYRYIIDYDYASPTDIKNQKFNVKYTLR